MADTGTLSAKQERFLTALLEHSTIRAAAAACHTPERTAYNWLRQPEFLAEYRAQQRTIYQANTGELQRAMSAAIKCLVKNLEASSEHAQVLAAKAILEHAQEAYKVQELELLLAQLESRFAE
jgi:predicted lipid-binding transport protein (Tim44 family)